MGARMDLQLVNEAHSMFEAKQRVHSIAAVAFPGRTADNRVTQNISVEGALHLFALSDNMICLVEEPDGCPTPIGALRLRRRHGLRLDVDGADIFSVGDFR